MMSQMKKCVVCDILNEYKDIATGFNTKLKQNVRIKEIIQDFHTLGIQNVPTKYYLEQHRDYCLSDFIVENKPLTPNILNNISYVTPLNEEVIPTEFKDKSLLDKTLWFQNKLVNHSALQVQSLSLQH